MANPNVLERTSLSISKNVIELIQGFQSFDYVAKNSVLAIEILDTVSEGDVKLTATTALVAANGRSYSHRDSPFMCMLQFRYDFRHEIARY